MSELQSRLTQLFDKHRLIFWYDEAGKLSHEFEALSLTDVTPLRIENNEYGLRYRIMREEAAQKFLLYSPTSRPADKDNWLLDLLLSHYEFQTDEVAVRLREMGLPLAFREVVERHAIFFQTQKRRDRLQRLLVPPPSHEAPEALVPLMIAAILGCEPQWESIFLTLVTRLAAGKSDYEDSLRRFGLDAWLWQEMERRYAYSSAQPGIRDFVVLLFRQAMGWEESLRREAGVLLARWQDSKQYREAFVQLSQEVGEMLEVGPDIEDMSREQLMDKEVFSQIDHRLIRMACIALVEEGETEAVRELVKNRRNSFWYERFLHPYEMLDYAARYFIQEKEISLQLEGLSDGIRRYAETWFQLDQLYRKFIYHYRQCDAADILQPLADRMEKHYVNAFLLPLNDNWQQQLDQAASWHIAGYPAQRSFYQKWVRPVLDRDNKMYVIISDALRYEAAEELLQRLQRKDRFQASLSPAWGVLPSYTQMGMAALLPHEKLALEPGSTNVLADGQPTMGTQNRAKVLSNYHQGRATAISAEHFMDFNKDKGRQLFRNHDLIYIYHNVIDKSGDDTASEATVFDAVEKAFDEIEALIKRITNFNGSNILITADHGFLFQQQATDEADFSSWEKQGEVLKVNRRYIIGSEMGKHDNLLPLTFKQLGLAGEGEALFPRSINRLRVKGAGSRYVHGGLSLQEIVIPVLAVKKRRSSDISYVDVDILASSRKITTNQIAIRLYQTDLVEEKVLARKLKVGFYDAEGKLLSEEQVRDFDSVEQDSRKREEILHFGFVSELSSYSGKDIYLRLLENISGTTQFRTYKQYPFRVYTEMERDF